MRTFTHQLSAALAALFIFSPVNAEPVLPDPVRHLIIDAYSQLGHTSISTDYVSGDILCSNPEASLPRSPSSRGGRLSVKLACPDSIRYIQVEVNVHVHVATAARNLQAGELVGNDDIAMKQGILSHQHRRAIIDAQAAVGKILTVNVEADQVITDNMLRAPVLVKRNQRVTIVVTGGGFSISRKAVALDSAGMGEVVRVSMDNRQIISGRVIGPGRLEATGY